MSIENLKTFDPFAEADEDTGQVKQNQQDYIHIRIQRTSVLDHPSAPIICAAIPEDPLILLVIVVSTCTRHYVSVHALTFIRAQWP
jgi:hypothetical protein